MPLYQRPSIPESDEADEDGTGFQPVQPTGKMPVPPMPGPLQAAGLACLPFPVLLRVPCYPAKQEGGQNPLSPSMRERGGGDEFTNPSRSPLPTKERQEAPADAKRQPGPRRSRGRRVMTMLRLVVVFLFVFLLSFYWQNRASFFPTSSPETTVEAGKQSPRVPATISLKIDTADPLSSPEQISEGSEAREVNTVVHQAPAGDHPGNGVQLVPDIIPLEEGESP